MTQPCDNHAHVGPATEDSRQDSQFTFQASRPPGARTTPQPSKGMARPRRSFRVWFVGAAIALLAAGSWLILQQLHSTRPARTPDAHLLVEAIELAAPAPDTAASAPPRKTLTTRLDELLAELKANAQALQGVLDGQKAQMALLTKLEQDVAALSSAMTQMQAQQVAAQQQAAAKPKAHVVKAAPPAPKPQAQLLSVDVWDGRPSAAIGSSDPADRRVRFLREGDQQQGITLKKADTHGQQAVFDVAGHEVVLSRDASR